MTTIVPCTFFIGQVSALCSCSCHLHAVKLHHRQVAWISNCAILWMQPLEMHDAQSLVEGGQSSSWSPEPVFTRGDKMTSTYTAAIFWFMVCAEQLTKASISRIYWKWEQLQNRICRVSCHVQLDAEVSICLVTGILLAAEQNLQSIMPCTTRCWGVHMLSDRYSTFNLSHTNL